MRLDTALSGWPCSPPRLRTLLAGLGARRTERVADADPKPFGRAEPDLVVALQGPAVAVGGETPAGDARYQSA